ncbi:MAG: hypothetical protein P0121_13840 [Nitrospira sp.]|nr:hypothetical protein [Nitrospira sp.]
MLQVVNEKRLPREGERPPFAESRDSIHTERAVLLRQLKTVIKRLQPLEVMRLNHARPLLLKLGAAK